MIEYQSEKEDILSDVYLKLILYQMQKDFPTDKNSKMKFVKILSVKNNYPQTLERNLHLSLVFILLVLHKMTLLLYFFFLLSLDFIS